MAGKTIAVRRLIYQILEKPDYEFRMVQQCSTPCCVNPLHYEIHLVNQEEVPEIPEMPELVEEPWTLEEASELLELYLLENDPKSWDDIVNHDLMLDVPHDLLREALLNINKEHLT